MVGTALLYCLLGIHFSVAAQPEENKPQPYEGAAAIINGGKLVREEAIMQVVEFVKREDAQLKERLQDSYTDLKEQLKEGDSRLKERLLEGDGQLKEQLKDGDSRMKEELDGDVAWLNGKIDKLEARMTEDLAEQREACEKLKDGGDEALSQQSSALIADLRKQMSEFQAELNITRGDLQSTQDQLNITRGDLQSTQDQLNITTRDLQSTQDQLNITSQGLETSQKTVQLLQAKVDQLTATAEGQGSVFTRWGEDRCPSHTSLIYSGVVGGSWYDHSGGGADYLCLGMHPQLDQSMGTPSMVNYLAGVEYDNSNNGRKHQDAVCAVCRAPEATTVMIPATVTCPDGWSRQYHGHLMTERHDHKSNKQYVCMDDAQRYRSGGSADRNGGLIYYTVADCGSLPCPPYAERLVTCVVCSM